MPRVHPSQILVVRLGAIGDVLLATPLVRALRRAHPDARLLFLTKREHADLLRGNPHVDEVLEWPEARAEPDGGRGAEPGPGADAAPAARSPGALRPRRTAPWSRPARALALRVRRGGPLWLVDLQASPRTLAFAFLLGPQRRFVWRKPYLRRQLLVSFRIDRYPKPPPSVAERYFDAVRAPGLTPDGGGLDLRPGDEAERAAREVLEEAGRELGASRWIAVAPGARWATKRWPPESFAAAARELAAGGGTGAAPGAARPGPAEGEAARSETPPNGPARRGVVVLGSGEDRPAAGVVADLLRSSRTPVLDLAGRLPLLASAAVLGRCEGILTNDSGLLHVAAALRVPAVALFGSTVPQLGFGPYRSPARVLGVEGLPCRPCTHVGRPACPLGHFRCMRGIRPEAAVRAAGELLAGGGRVRRGGGAGVVR
ncbi:MAG TPA: glycosyltransferase family 9 protein [Gemmatimonadota bacterium]|jgi:heptosyltransferase-2